MVTYLDHVGVSPVDPLGADFAYVQVANNIAVRIKAGEITHKLPSERSLAEEYGVAYQTVRHAMEVLRERELIKLAALGSAVAAALRQRGVAEPAASLAAEAGVAIFRVAFDRWVDDSNERELPELIHRSLDELKAVASGR